MKANDKLNYYGKQVTVLEANKTHVLILFENGCKYCVNKNSFYK